MPYFQQSGGATVNGGTFVDINGFGNVVNVGPDTRKGEGVKLLLDYVQSEAMHDSGSRGALGCHPDTREEYIRTITDWGSGEWQSDKRALLMTGPAGAGKSAIAQTCAQKIQAAGYLGASFFFFRPSGWNDPKKFIPTIVYQLATRYPAYQDYVSALILSDPLALGKAMDIQFRELLVKPFQKLNSVGQGMVIIIDGLDECASVDAQIQIIKLITTSIHEQTTPFLWAFFSRPEPPITSAFSSEIATTVSWNLPLTLSGNADSDIKAYICGSFQAIRAKYSIPTSAWPTKDDIHRLVSQSAGLFIYAVTAIRYIDGFSKAASGLEERLRAVLQLDPTVTESPFSALDQLYLLVMMQIPPGVLPHTKSLLLLRQFRRLIQDPAQDRFTIPVTPSVRSCRLALGLSWTEFHVAISNLYSVLDLKISESGEPVGFQFYHRSFPDFLIDPRRSKEYFIGSYDVRQRSLEMIVRTLVTAAYTDATDEGDIDGFIVQAFFLLVEQREQKLGKTILRQISNVDWRCFHRVSPNLHAIKFRSFMQKIPLLTRWRLTIARPSCKGLYGIRQQMFAIFMPDRCHTINYILGKGDKKVLMVHLHDKFMGNIYEIRYPPNEK